ncbi:MAG TPA: RsmE family RNA methyltransferase [Opitutaceae bacterium]
MNLILFENSELEHPLPRADRRAEHMLRVLRLAVGASCDVALVNGPRGKATLVALDEAVLTLRFAWPAAEARATQCETVHEPVTLVVGLPRPQTARDILRDATTLGVAAIHFVRTEKAEASYAQSSLWSSGEWRRHALAGAEQAFDARLPEITHGRSLKEVLAALPAAATRLTLDNYESPAPLGEIALPAERPLVLALGAERGWSAAEREQFRAGGFAFAHLGPRVLRTETAVIAALAIVRARLGRM